MIPAAAAAASVSSIRRSRFFLLLLLFLLLIFVDPSTAWSFQQQQQPAQLVGVIQRRHHQRRNLPFQSYNHPYNSPNYCRYYLKMFSQPQQHYRGDEQEEEGGAGAAAVSSTKTNDNNNNSPSSSTTTTTDTNAAIDALYHEKENRNGSVMGSTDDVQQQGEESTTSAVPINSLVFQILSEDDSVGTASYVLAVLKSVDRVDLSALHHNINNNGSNKRILRIQLAPSEQVYGLCGYEPGCIPPMNLNPEPQLTLVEESLLVSSSQKKQLLLGGGGGLYQLQTLLEQPKVYVASFREEADEKSDREGDDAAVAAAETQTHHYHKPYFAVAPPPPTILDEQRKSLQPVAFSVVGRLSGVRRMARTLMFCDLAPPTVDESASSEEDNDKQYPWRCGQTGDDMAVQLIIGKTFCQRFGDDNVDGAVSALKNIKVGQLVLVTGVTNVQNKQSLKNWMKTKTLDLVVASVQILQEDDPDAAWRPIRRQRQRSAPGVEDSVSDDDDDFSKSNLWGVYHGSSVPSVQKRGPSSYSNEPGMSYLSVNELYGSPNDGDNDQFEEEDASTTTTPSVSPYIRMVDDLETVREFHGEVTRLLLQLTTAATMANTTNSLEEDDVSPPPAAVSLVGMDCEWLPNFLMKEGGRNQPQPVLVLQVCLHSLKKVYLFDLQTLLRPLLPTSETMNDLESAVGEALGVLLHSQRLIKVGFQLVQDVRRLAASYPHISSLQNVNSVLEASRLGKKAMYLLKQKNSRVVTKSLARLTERVLGKTLNKDQQCSDWSARPLNAKQKEYAALDAVVTPVIVEELRYQVDANFYDTETGPAFGRWENDSSFREALTSWRFLFLDQGAEISRSALKKLNAKRIVGNPWIVTQTWITGREPPRLPSVPTKDGDPYHDRTGTLRIPSQMTCVQNSNEKFEQLLTVMVGERMGRSKDSCLNRVLKDSRSFPEGAVLDFPQRSGYVEFEDAVALFVNAPGKPGGPRPRSYPNEWLVGGKILTWFLRENDWKQGTTNLAKNILSTESPLMPVVLFVRMENGQFLCCGGCQVTAPEEKQSSDNESPREWDLVQLNLGLLDWERLNLCEDFQELVNVAN